ncbi:IS30 family transposase [Xenorhabdus bovienii]|uniref:IS30 family transposase n=2 Tax=Xenorhabdus bovienii TaxID=40576 RepID=UPI0023B32FB7|nr:IS30 family transposase [Xenorhabdus bovienii]MDE9438014.1 IS30 family transposase [Xenorhabdus bovienii]MDE9499828.1 IS30 family transposase [Xenorhabdus bovienii]
MHKQTRQYRQLTPEQRYQLQALYNKGFPQHQIAESLGVHSSTVSRELKRNANNKQYCAKSAEILKNNRKKTAFKFKKYPPRHENILSEGLSMGWSPENIDYRMRLECPEIALSHSTLYRRIREDRDAGGALYKRLPRFGKTRWKGGKRKAGQSHIPNRVDISQRPAIVDKRARIGDFEGDTIYGQNAYLVTLVDRKSRLLLMAKTQDRTAEAVSNVMNTLLNRVSSVHTVTLDNGGEFARHEKVSQSTKAQIYFARPYASYQRGTNENTNGLVRRQWPKGTAFGSLTEQDVSELELRLNMIPRKVLNGLTPIEAYTGRTLHLLC